MRSAGDLATTARFTSCSFGERSVWRLMRSSIVVRLNVDERLGWGRRRHAVWQQAEQEPGHEAADVREVVDEGELESNVEVHHRPEEDLAEKTLGPRLVTVLRRAPDGEDECAEK